MKWRYTIVNEGVVEAPNMIEAEAAAWQACDEGRGISSVQLESLEKTQGMNRRYGEPLTKERDGE